MATPKESLLYRFFIRVFGESGQGSILIPSILYLVILGLLLLLFGIGNTIVAGVSAILTLMLGTYIYTGWAQNEIPAKPPHVALVKLFGNYTGGVKNPGDRFFAFRGLVYSFDTIKVDRRNLDLETEEITPDNATSEVIYSITWQPIRSNGESLVKFIASGLDSGVEDILTDMADRCVREWITQGTEGPDTWIDLRKSGSEGVAVILRRLNGLNVFGNDKAVQNAILQTRIPASTFFKAMRNISPNEHEKRVYGNDWVGITSVLQQNPLVRRGVMEFVEHVDRAMTGKIAVEIEDLGIQVTRIIITSIKPLGELAKKAELKATEQEERKGEKVEADHVKDLIQGYVDMGFSLQEARDLAQTERRKVVKDIKTHQVELPKPVLDALQNIAGMFGNQNNP